jgi:RNA polymerase sigma factor (sigma-70 family)
MIPADLEALATHVRRAQAGDTLAMTEVLEVLTPLIRRWCGPIALDDGADAVQETLIVILRRLGDVRDPAAVLGWARTVAVREALRVARSSVRTVAAELTELPAPGDPILAADISDVLSRCSPEHRAVLMLRDLEGFDESEAAAMLRIPVGTVRSRLHRARRSFRDAWRAEGGTR